MIEIKCGYTDTIYWKVSQFDTFEKAWEYLETLRPASDRPSFIIIEGFTDEQIEDVGKILWVPMVFSVKNGYLYGGFGFMKKMICRMFGYIKGEKNEDSPI